jgi:hypothetical protein
MCASNFLSKYVFEDFTTDVITLFCCFYNYHWQPVRVYFLIDIYLEIVRDKCYHYETSQYLVILSIQVHFLDVITVVINWLLMLYIYDLLHTLIGSSHLYKIEVFLKHSSSLVVSITFVVVLVRGRYTLFSFASSNKT